MARKAKQREEDRLPGFCDYGAGVLAERIDKMLAHTEGAASGNDTRAIHQMRVWSRRSRAALDVFGVCFTEQEAGFDAVVAEVKTVTRALGAARDLDVMRESIQGRKAGLPPDQQAGVDSFLDHLQAQRAAKQDAVTAAVKHLEKRNLRQQLRRLADRQGYKAVTVELPSVPTVAAEAPAVPSSNPAVDATPDTSAEPTTLTSILLADDPAVEEASRAEANSILNSRKGEASS